MKTFGYFKYVRWKTQLELSPNEIIDKSNCKKPNKEPSSIVKKKNSESLI